MGFLYDLIYIIVFAFYAPVLAVRGKLHRGYPLRFGDIATNDQKRLAEKKNLWLHAVSVGEVLAIVDIIRRLKTKFPSHRIVLTTVTKTGFETANKRLDREDVILFAPMDLSWVVKKFIRVINPKLYVAAETEIWPNLYRHLHEAHVPIVQVNGRISDKSLRGYARVSGFIKKSLSYIDLCCMQSEQDRKRIIHIGAAPEKVHVTGNIKFDNLPEGEKLQRGSLGFADNDLILIAGSTHANEEEMILDVFNRLRGAHRNLKLILSPRHVERAADVKALVESKQLKASLLSHSNGRPVREDDVLLVDRIGVLKDIYSIADVVFIGKTLAVGGGQNMIEPAAFGKATIVGPMTYNFKDVMRIFLDEEAIIQVSNWQALEAALNELLADQKKRQQIGVKAKAVVERYKGASSKTIDLIERLIVR